MPNRTTTPADIGNACPNCGLRTASGEPDCNSLRDSLLARDFEQPALYWRFHRLAVDAYCVQHSAYVKSAKSLAAHLCGLCVAFEHGNNADALTKLNRWLSTNPELRKPDLPVFRGALTIADAYGIVDSVEYGRAVTAWARSAWDAYQALQPVARDWLARSAARPAVRR